MPPTPGGLFWQPVQAQNALFPTSLLRAEPGWDVVLAGGLSVPKQRRSRASDPSGFVGCVHGALLPVLGTHFGALLCEALLGHKKEAKRAPSVSLSLFLSIAFQV